jgi:D-sedoheptulose 7-phosphate isomerase
MDLVTGYLNTVGELLLNTPSEKLEEISAMVLDAYKTGKQVFVIGNGGSAATASHLCCDLQKSVSLDGGKQFKVMSLTDNVPVMTAWANDFEYEDIFARQLSTWVQPGDLVIAISGSGNSKNVIKAVEVGNESGAVTIGFSGFDGGKLAKTALHNVIVPSNDMQHIEDLHMVFSHLIFRYVLDGVKK